MAGGNQDGWVPQERHIRDAHVMALAKALKQPDFDSLLAYSNAHPAEYWKGVLKFLGVQWTVEPTGYVDLSRGPEFPDWFPGGTLNWVNTVLAWADRPETANAPALIAEQEDGTSAKLTFAEMAAKVRSFASGLRKRGFKRGDRIGLLCENGIETNVSMMAISYLGAIGVPLFSGFGVDAIVSRLEAAEARAFIATTGFHRRGRPVAVTPTILEARQKLPTIELIIWKAAKAPDDGVTWDEIAATPFDGIPAAEMSPNDPFLVIYTSGTTGKPKGVVHVHAGHPLKIAHDAAVNFNIGRGDVFCWPADMGWIAGSNNLATALMRGATLVLYDGTPDFPDWSRMSRVIERYRVTHYGSSPTLIRGLAANVPTSLLGDRSFLKLLITAGEVIDPEHFTWYQNVFGLGNPVINYTGGTEVSGSLVSSVVVKPIASGGFNTASPGVQVAVVDPSGKRVKDSVGELAILKPFVGMTRSFWQDEKRYLETYWQTVPGLWVHGDLAIEWSKGGFVLLGRSDDTIKVAGKRLGPAEVEEIILKLPGIHEAAAIGVEDSTKGEKLVVFVVRGAEGGDSQQLAQAVTSEVELKLGKPFKPAKVHFVKELPKTRSSKVMRRLIRRVYTKQPLGDVSSLANPAALDEIQSAIPS